MVTVQAYVYSSRTVKGRAVLEESAITSNSDAPVRGMLDSQVGALLPCFCLSSCCACHCLGMHARPSSGAAQHQPHCIQR